jgi:hypothetical protein
MIYYVENESFTKIDDNNIMLRFLSYKDRQGHEAIQPGKN